VRQLTAAAANETSRRKKIEKDFIFDRRFWRVEFERRKGGLLYPFTTFYIDNLGSASFVSIPEKKDNPFEYRHPLGLYGS
jgi:hypothetical protein